MRSNVRRRIYALPLPLLTGPPCVINTQNRHQALILNLILIHLHQWLDTSGYKICNLRDILIDLKHRRNRCKVCHQRKYFDQSGLSREREFGPGAFCPQRKCGAERFQARHAIRLTCFLGTAHLRFQRRKLVDNCSSSELTWCYWPCPRLPQDLLLTPDLGRCHVENIPRVSSKISREYC